MNKVETMVEGYFDISASPLLSPEQKKTLHNKLRNRINAEGLLQVRSQVHRSQLSNKAEVVKKIVALMEQALKKEKPRISTKPTKSSVMRRLERKKRASEHKRNRRTIREAD